MFKDKDDKPRQGHRQFADFFREKIRYRSSWKTREAREVLKTSAGLGSSLTSIIRFSGPGIGRAWQVTAYLLMSIVCLDWPFLLQRLHFLTAGKWTRFPLGLRLLNMLDNLPSKNWQEWANGEEGADVHRCFHNVASIYANISFWWHHSCMFWCINRAKTRLRHQWIQWPFPGYHLFLFEQIY